MNRYEKRMTLTEEDLTERTWEQDGLHFSHPLTPLFASYMVPAMTEGTRRAMAALKAPMMQFVGKVHDGYFYQAVIPRRGDPEHIQREHLEAIRPLLGHQRQNLSRWVSEVLWPLHQEIDRMARHLASCADARNALDRLEEIYLTFWEAHFRIVLPRMTAGFGFEQAFAKAFPDRDSQEAYGLLVGEMNKSLESDRRLWQLAQALKAVPQVAQALAEDNIYGALSEMPTAQPVLQELDEYLQEYGWRTVYAHEFVHPTWVEDPNYCLAVIRGYLERDFDFDRHWQHVIRQRDEEYTQLVNQIADPALQSAFREHYALALEAWPIDEDHHFYIDAMLPARSRQLVLKVGDLLVSKGVMQARDDVCFLYLDELRDVLGGHPPHDLAKLIDKRRTTHQEQARMVPSPRLGRTPEPGQADPVATMVFGAGSPGLEGATREVRGFAASKGRYVGPVRIVRGPEEFFKVQSGDVLVCRSTAPSWTGLFATVGAVITETGGILSHASTVAREYGIPCVVGTREATRVFADGDLVVVDGNSGFAAIDH